MYVWTHDLAPWAGTSICEHVWACVYTNIDVHIRMCKCVAKFVSCMCKVIVLVHLSIWFGTRFAPRWIWNTWAMRSTQPYFVAWENEDIQFNTDYITHSVLLTTSPTQCQSVYINKGASSWCPICVKAWKGSLTIYIYCGSLTIYIYTFTTSNTLGHKHALCNIISY